GTPRVMQRSHGVWYSHESVRWVSAWSFLASASGRIGTLPLSGSTTIALRRAFRPAAAGPSTPHTEPAPVPSLGGNHFRSAARRVASSEPGAWKGVLSKFVHMP